MGQKEMLKGKVMEQVKRGEAEHKGSIDRVEGQLPARAAAR
jgi:hypothetical protein